MGALLFFVGLAYQYLFMFSYDILYCQEKEKI